MRGVAVHIGSQLSTLEPLETAFGKVGALIAELRAAGCTVTHADLGGGLGVPYKAGESLPSPAEYGAMVARVTRDWGVQLMFEPGRVIAGNAGVLLTRVIRAKRSGNGPPFVVVDAAMNDLARPAMYGAWHDFDAVAPTGDRMTAHIVDRSARRAIPRWTANAMRWWRATSPYFAPQASWRRWPILQLARFRG